MTKGVTVEEVLDLLPIVANRGWRVTGIGFIRDRDDRCPICALAHEVTGGEVDLRQMARLAQLQMFPGEQSQPLSYAFDRIIMAADVRSAPWRTLLMQALGMRVPS